MVFVWKVSFWKLSTQMSSNLWRQQKLAIFNTIVLCQWKHFPHFLQPFLKISFVNNLRLEQYLPCHNSVHNFSANFTCISDTMLVQVPTVEYLIGPACQYSAVLRIRNKSFGSGVGSGSGLQLVLNPDPDSNPDPNPDSNPDSNPGFGSGSESWIRIRIRNWPKLPLFVLKFLRSLKLKKGCHPSAPWLGCEQIAK
jgi:hypothetical protein